MTIFAYDKIELKDQKIYILPLKEKNKLSKHHLIEMIYTEKKGQTT